MLNLDIKKRFRIWLNGPELQSSQVRTIYWRDAILLGLPIELLEDIAEFLTLKELRSLGLTCMVLRSIYKRRLYRHLLLLESTIPRTPFEQPQVKPVEKLRDFHKNCHLVRSVVLMEVAKRLYKPVSSFFLCNGFTGCLFSGRYLDISIYWAGYLGEVKFQTLNDSLSFRNVTTMSYYTNAEVTMNEKLKGLALILTSFPNLNSLRIESVTPWIQSPSDIAEHCAGAFEILKQPVIAKLRVLSIISYTQYRHSNDDGWIHPDLFFAPVLRSAMDKVTDFSVAFYFDHRILGLSEDWNPLYLEPRAEEDARWLLPRIQRINLCLPAFPIELRGFGRSTCENVKTLQIIWHTLDNYYSFQHQLSRDFGLVSPFFSIGTDLLVLPFSETKDYHNFIGHRRNLSTH